MNVGKNGMVENLFVWFLTYTALGNPGLLVSDVDDMLSLLENKARREILERLVTEPHYAYQLADQIVYRHKQLLNI